jgi:hypothetical protein
MTSSTIFYKGSTPLHAAVAPKEPYSFYTSPAVPATRRDHLLADLEALGVMTNCVITDYHSVATGIHVQSKDGDGLPLPGDILNAIAVSVGRSVIVHL